MSDRMTFPDTVEEFMEQYKIVDEQKIYTNGTELVPIFRMEQWFKHQLSAHPDLTAEEWKLIKQLRSYHNGSYAKVLDRLIAAAQPEIIYCRECTYGEQDDNGNWYCYGLGCTIGSGDGNGFCADAERREDE